MAIENSIQVWLFSKHRRCIIDLAAKAKRKMLTKYKKKIENDWYDLDDIQIESRIRATDIPFDTLCDLIERIVASSCTN